MCFFPLMMTLLSTDSRGRDMPKYVVASADTTLTLSKDASVVNVLRSATGQAAVVGAGGIFLRTRLLCTLSAIYCSNKQIYAGFGGKVGQLAPKQYVKGREKEGGNQMATSEWHGGIK